MSSQLAKKTAQINLLYAICPSIFHIEPVLRQNRIGFTSEIRELGPFVEI